MRGNYLFSMQPFYAMMLALIYIGVTYLLVRNEKKYIAYGMTIFSSFLNFAFLFLWLEKTIFLMTSTGGGLQRFKTFDQFVNKSYFALFIPLLILFAWYGIKKIMLQDQFLWLKIIFVLIYVGALVGLFVLGQLVFSLLYYGFAP